MTLCSQRLNCHPSVGECDGEYHVDSRKNILQWKLPIIDKANKSGSMEFFVPSSIPGDFFPLQISFTSKTPYADLKIIQVLNVDDDTAVKFSSETIFYADKYEIV